jgi:hypothetical protein
MIVSSLACMLFALNAQGSMSVEDSIAPALSAAGLSPTTARFDAGMMGLFRTAEFTTPLYTAASLNPWQAPFLFNVLTNDIEAQAGKPNEILNVGTRYVGTGSRRTLISDPLASLRPKPDENVQTSLAFALQTLAGERDVSALTDVPIAVKQATTLILRALDQSKEHYDLFFDSAMGNAVRTPKTPKELLLTVARGLKDDAPSKDFAEALALFRRSDIRYLVAGAHDISLAVQDACKLLGDVPANQKYRIQVRTPYGYIALSGGEDSTYGRDGKGYALIIDTGGNDSYINVPMSDGENSWSSIVIDTAGDDRYLSDATLAEGSVGTHAQRKDQKWELGPSSAFMGYSLLFDLKGDDLYRSAKCGIASGRLGVAILHEGGGNDTYDGYADSLGFGMFGAGILEDMNGNDTYNGFTQVQGVGQTTGFGALIDHGGNDTYTTNDRVIDFPSAQSPEHNVSMSQGAGNGTRRDFLDAHQLAGGIGLLLDCAGDDKYTGAVFAQACGYLQGIGILRDKAGTDSYNGLWYVQGASAHFAVGFLQDDSGDDKYTATMNMAQGAGHDLGAGYLLDLDGNDTYVAPNLSLGAGNANGLGMLLEMSGNDSYTSSGLTLGQSGEAPKGSLRERALCFGVFCDLGGSDVFPPTFAWAKNGGTQVNWMGKRRTPEESQFGVFYDK